ncbi:DHA2 family multidrug resistance protein-like MFS transporter [Frondihabitans sp. PhB188]|uniref:DHA2 family efflux MFS transporter permease subunit n=1 Tax=Frondihabitans sp. PhB188 TaxID=2485200 RepID=UPI000F462815|nr:DHA2 family efflux MFS transporter permease subunit [Frondihabitans sp. PhB188]ROQ39756.1 DHA2 family multidrug resistance protein-like MFS transporter [Frondihabitans sp. PhB188]
MSTSTTPIPVAGGVSGTFEIGAARRTVALVGLLLSMLMANIDASIVNVALPQLAGDLHVTAGDAVWVATAFLLAVACCLPLAIGLADQLGRKRLFLIGTPVFTLASLFCALSPSLEALVASRVLQGAAASLLFAVVIPTYRQLFPPARLGSILGLNAMIVALGISAGPALGGVILANLSWPWLFLINVPIGALASVLVLVALPHTPPSRGAFDLVGALTGGAAIACFLLGVHQLADDSTVWLAGVLLAGCAGFAMLFLRHEKRAVAPVLPPSMFSGRFVLAVLAAFWSFFGQGVAFVALPFLFQTAYHATPLESALLFTPWPLVIVIVAPIAGRVADSFSPTLMATIGLALFTLGLLSLALLGDHPPIWQVLLCTAFTGFGFAVFQAPNNRDMMDAATPRMSGPAAGMLNINRTIAQSAGAGAVSMALVLTGATSLADQASASSGVLWVAVIGAGLAAVLAFWRLRRAPAAR